MSKDEVPMDADALARLKRLAGKSTLILTHYGRKSGKPYEVKIWFVVDGDTVFIGTANVHSRKNP
jgi:hypothetical protein